MHAGMSPPGRFSAHPDSRPQQPGADPVWQHAAVEPSWLQQDHNAHAGASASVQAELCVKLGARAEQETLVLLSCKTVRRACLRMQLQLDPSWKQDTVRSSAQTPSCSYICVRARRPAAAAAGPACCSAAAAGATSRAAPVASVTCRASWALAWPGIRSLRCAAAGKRAECCCCDNRLRCNHIKQASRAAPNISLDHAASLLAAAALKAVTGATATLTASVSGSREIVHTRMFATSHCVTLVSHSPALQDLVSMAG